MKPTALIITEDVVKIQTLTKTLGKSFAFFYINWLKIRLSILSFCLKPFYRVVILATNDIGITGKKNFYYGDLLSSLNYAKNRKLYWKYTKQITKIINNYRLSFIKYRSVPATDTFANKLAVYLTYHYFIYQDLYQNLFRKHKFARIFIVGNSYHEQLATHQSKKAGIPATKLTFLSLNWLQKLLQHFLLTREYQIKLSQFIFLAQKSTHPSKKFKGAILLSADFYRHLKTLMPIYRQLQRTTTQPLLVTDSAPLPTQASNLYPDEEANSAYLSPYCSQLSIKEIKAWQNQVNQIYTSDHYQPVISISLAATKPMIINSLILGRLYLEAGFNLFERLKPKGLVVASDVRMAELTLAAVAKKTKTASILVSPNTMLDLAEINPYNLADKIAVVGKYIKSQLINQGINAKKIHLTGDLVKESLSSDSVSARVKVYSALGLTAEKKLILAISFRPTWMIPREEKEAFISMAHQACKQIPNAVLVIKPHPTEKRYRVFEELKSWGLKNILVSDNNNLSLHALLSASSVVLQTWSFTIFEAIMNNKPVISVNPFGKNYHYFLPILKSGGAVEVTSFNQLSKWLKILTNPNNPQTINHLQKARSASQDFIYHAPGNASKKVVQLLLGK